MISFISFLFWLCISGCNAWLIMRAMEHLISLKQRKQRLKRCVMFVGCYILSGTIIYIGDTFNIFAAVFLFMAVVLICCEGSFLKRITLGAMYASTILSFNVLRDNYFKPLFEALEIFLFPENRMLYNEYVIENLSLDFIRSASVLASFMFSLLLYVSTKKSMPNKDYTLSDSLWKLMLLLTLMPFSIVISLVTLSPRDSYPYLLASHYWLMPVGYLPILFIAIFSFVGLLRCIIVLARQQKLEQQSMFTEINRKYYESMEQQHFEIRRLKHDLANHLQVLSALPESKRDAYLKALTENAALQSFSYCLDSTVNAVLTVKKSFMEQNKIRMDCSIDIPDELPFEKTDVCALYANALDNAAEACLKLPESERVIILKTKAQKGLFCLDVSNPIPVSSNDNLAGIIPPTSKPDKRNHGLGLQSIKEIVERYHGTLELGTENGVFTLFLYIPLSQTECDSAN